MLSASDARTMSVDLPEEPARTTLMALARLLRGRIDDRVDWLRVIALANRHLVGPELFRAVVGSAESARIDEEALAYLRALDAANIERNRAIAGELEAIATELNAGGIRPIVIKGAAELAQVRDPAATARMIRDIDLLVTPEEAPRAHRILERRGYSCTGAANVPHSFGGYSKAGAAAPVDLHHALPCRCAAVIAESDLREHLRLARYGSAELWLPTPTLQLTLNVAHEMLHDFGIVSGFFEVRYLLELVSLTRCDAHLDRHWLDSKLTHEGFALACELQSRMAVLLFGANPFPRAARSRLGALLHRRRLIKARLDLAGRIEWSVLRAALRQVGMRAGWFAREALRPD